MIGMELVDKGEVVAAATNDNDGTAVADKGEVVVAADNNNDGTAVVALMHHRDICVHKLTIDKHWW
jgi:hypothetical protein